MVSVIADLHSDSGPSCPGCDRPSSGDGVDDAEAAPLVDVTAARRMESIEISSVSDARNKNGTTPATHVRIVGVVVIPSPQI